MNKRSATIRVWNLLDYTRINERSFITGMLKKRSFYLAAIVTFILLLFSFGQSAVAADLPKATSDFFYYDEPNILTSETKELIMNVNDTYEQTVEKPQIVVAVIDSLNGETIEDYSVALFEKWKIGNTDYNNGILILLALEEREIRFEIGYGLEGALTDGNTGKILDNNLAYLSNNLFDGALQQIFRGTALEVAAEYQYETEANLASSTPVVTETPLTPPRDNSFIPSTIRFFKSLKPFNVLFIIVCIGFAIFTPGSGGSSKGGRNRTRSGSSKKSSRRSGAGGRSGGGGSSRKF